ncbi:MAG: AAA family ATPase [Bacteroidetes bacterium]|nr:AAA family ATPase [Bacteroidota bacterium]
MMFKKASKKQSKLRLAIEGASGSGKTYSALILAETLAKTLGEKVAVIDTEHGSASLYSDKFNFDVVELKPPYTPEAYIRMIDAAEKMGYGVLIIDSMSHEWNGKGGCLDLVSKVDGNSYTAWGKVTPRHDNFINAILSTNMHVIGTMRSKTAYETGTDAKTNKMTIQKKGTAPIQRESVDYEFTVVFDLNQNHMASVSKDRTSLFDGKDFIIEASIGKEILGWLNSGEKAKTPHQQITEILDRFSGGDEEKGKAKLREYTKRKDETVGKIDSVNLLNHQQASYVLGQMQTAGL